MGEVLPRDEMASFGREGLLEAARRYDPDRGVPFRRFAQYRIKGCILDGMRRHAELPRRTHEKVRALRAATAAAEGMFEDTAAAVAAGLQGTAADQRLADHLATLATAMAVGFGAPTAIDDNGARTIVSEDDDPEQRLAQAELIGMVQRELARLPEVEATLIRRYVLDEQPLEKAAASVGLSKSWASRVMARGVATLTRRLQAAQ